MSALLVATDTTFLIRNAFHADPLVRSAQVKINVQLAQDRIIIMKVSASYVPNPAQNVQVHHFVQAAPQRVMPYLREAV